MPIQTEANAEKVSLLVEMGFSESASKQALIRHHNNIDLSMNYLLENGGEEEAHQRSGE